MEVFILAEKISLDYRLIRKSVKRQNPREILLIALGSSLRSCKIPNFEIGGLYE